MLRHLLAIALALLTTGAALAQRPGDRADRMRERSRQIDARLADDPYVGIRHLVEGRSPIRQHIHAVVRTPNGNDYGKDLLRQHYERDH